MIDISTHLQPHYHAGSEDEIARGNTLQCISIELIYMFL
jgi:hypothetical protein